MGSQKKLDFSNPRFYEIPDNLNQTSLSFTSQKLLFTPDFFKTLWFEPIQGGSKNQDSAVSYFLFLCLIFLIALLQKLIVLSFPTGFLAGYVFQTKMERSASILSAVSPQTTGPEIGP